MKQFTRILAACSSVLFLSSVTLAEAKTRLGFNLQGEVVAKTTRTVTKTIKVRRNVTRTVYVKRKRSRTVYVPRKMKAAKRSRTRVMYVKKRHSRTTFVPVKRRVSRIVRIQKRRRVTDTVIFD